MLGIAKNNIKTFSNQDARETEIKIAIKGGYQVSASLKNLIFIYFFAGHGMASMNGKNYIFCPMMGNLVC